MTHFLDPCSRRRDYTQCIFKFMKVSFIFLRATRYFMCCCCACLEAQLAEEVLVATRPLLALSRVLVKVALLEVVLERLAGLEALAGVGKVHVRQELLHVHVHRVAVGKERIVCDDR